MPQVTAGHVPSIAPGVAVGLARRLRVCSGSRISPSDSDREEEQMAEPVGRRRWAIAEGWIPARSHGPEPAMTSHETVCLLNASDRDATVSITVFFEDRDPVGPYQIQLAARRTRHVRFNDLDDPEPIPRETDYASVIESDVPIVVQHTRLDSRQAENALLTTIAYPDGA